MEKVDYGPVLCYTGSVKMSLILFVFGLLVSVPTAIIGVAIGNLFR